MSAEPLPEITIDTYRLLHYWDVLTDKERFIFECLFNISRSGRPTRGLSYEELAEAYRAKREDIAKIYHDIITKLIEVDILDESLGLDL